MTQSEVSIRREGRDDWRPRPLEDQAVTDLADPHCGAVEDCP